MSDAVSASRNVPAALPPTFGITDPQMRTWAEAMSSAWAVRNGGGGPEAEQFVRKGEAGLAAESAVIRVLGAAFGGVPGGTTLIGLSSVQAVIDEVLSSKVVEYLRTPIAQIAAPTAKLQGLIDRVRNGLASEVDFRIGADLALSQRIDTVAASSGDASALVAAEATARSNADAALAISVTTVRAALDSKQGGVLNSDPACSNLAEWTVSAGAANQVTGLTDGKSGKTAFNLLGVTEINSKFMPCDAGRIYRVSVWVRKPSGPDSFYLRLHMYSGNGTELSYAVPGCENVALTGAWVRLSGSVTAPASAVTMRLIITAGYPSGGGVNQIQDARVEDESGITALVQAESAARVSRDDALASDTSLVAANLGTTNASVATEITTRANQFSAQATVNTGLLARVGSTETAVLNETSLRSSKDNSLAQAINTMWASIGGASALIQDASLAAVGPAAVTATKWQQVQAAVTDPNTGLVSATSIRQELNVYASKVDGSLNATYGLKINVNGAVSGFALMSSAGAGSPPGAASSTFAILADRLSLISPTNVSVLPFTVDGAGNAIFAGWIYAAGGTFAGALSAASGTFAGSLTAASGTFSGSLTAAAVSAVNTINLAGNAVTVPITGSVAGIARSVIVAGSRTTSRTIGSITTSSIGAGLVTLFLSPNGLSSAPEWWIYSYLIAECSVTDIGGTLIVGFSVKRNGTTIWTLSTTNATYGGGTSTRFMHAPIILDTPGPGVSCVYSLEIYSETTGGATNHAHEIIPFSFVLTESKR